MSEETDKSQKTEEPTQRRLDDARQKGQIPLSRDVGHWFVFLGFFLFVYALMPTTMVRLMGQMHDAFFAIGSFTQGNTTITAVSLDMVRGGLTILAPIFGLFVCLSLCAGLSQTRFSFSFKSLAPKLSKISPLKGLSKLFGPKALVEFVKNLIKFVCVAFLSIHIFWPEITQMDTLSTLSLDGQIAELYDKTTTFLIIIVCVMFVVSLLDYGYQKFQHMQSLKMSKQELKEEFKDTEGDPMIRARLRQLRQERSRGRMMQDVKTATVIITNPTHFSVALTYDPAHMDAPMVVAKGIDYLALHIREIAIIHHVPIIQSPPLARALYGGVKVGQQIAPEHYEAVAGIVRLLVERGQLTLSDPRS